MAPFPKDKYNRCFQPNWSEKFSWLEYSKEKNGIFCYYCRQFALSSTKHSITSGTIFINQGFDSWNKALQSNRGLLQHEKSATHLSAMFTWTEKQKRSDLNKGICNLIGPNVLEMRRYYVDLIINVIRFLIENELSFRGNWDKLSGVEGGVFMNLFKYTLSKDEKLRNCHEIIPDHVKYTSPDIQNELIDVIAYCVRQNIVAEVNKSKYFTLFLYGTKDRQRREILYIAVRYIKNGKPVESVLGFEYSRFFRC